MANRTPTFYVFHGDDEFSRKAEIKSIQEKMNDPSNLNIAVLDGAEVSVAQILNMVSSVPFLADRRLVIVEGMLTALDKRGKSAGPEYDILLEGLQKLPDFARLVFHENTTLKSNNPVIKLIHEDPSGLEKAFNAPRNPVQWIIKQAKETYGAEIERPAAVALASVIGDDMRAADNEVAKLAAYAGGERPITQADVALLTTYVSEPQIFDMVDAIGQQDGKTAVRICNELLAAQPALSLFGMVNRQFRLLIMAREYLDETGSASGMASAIGVHDFVGKKLSSQARQFASLEQLEALYHKLAQYDLDIKLSRISDKAALQLFIAGVTK